MSFDEENDRTCPQDWLDMAGDEIKMLRSALEKIAKYDEEPIWMDSRDDAADMMLSVARAALGMEGGQP